MACWCAAAGVGGLVHYWRKANALMKATAAAKHNPAKAEELKAIWMLTDEHMRKAAHFASRFKRTGIAAAMGAPLLYMGWLRSSRYYRQQDW